MRAEHNAILVLKTLRIHRIICRPSYFDSLVTTGERIVQVAADYLLQRLGEVGTLKFIRMHNAMIRINNVSKNAEVRNAIIAHALSQSLSLSPSEHQEYIPRTPMILKFLYPTKMGGITRVAKYVLYKYTLFTYVRIRF
jgi:hypothetical protein